MPPLTRWFIRTALLYLVLSLVSGVLVAAGSLTRFPYPIASLSTLYFQILMVGWITQLIFGVAYWMFPTFSREHPRRSPMLGWVAYVSLNAGLLLQVVVELLGIVNANAAGWMGGVSILLQFAAALAFVINTWNRVKGR